MSYYLVHQTVLGFRYLKKLAKVRYRAQCLLSL